MTRLPSTVSQTYHEFWAGLVPRSNRQTGFSLRRPTRRSVVQFDRLGFYFRYHLAYEAPNATVTFALRRSDGDQIYAALVRQRHEIEAAFGEPLLWLHEAIDPTDHWPSPALSVTIPCPPLHELDRSQWPTLQSRMIDAMVRLERAVVPLLDQWLVEQ